MRGIPIGIGLRDPGCPETEMDLHADIEGDVTLAPGERRLVPTGLALAIPPGFEGQVRPRSGLAHRTGLTLLNAPGTIDSDYRGELQVIVGNIGRETFVIQRGMRIAQMIISQVVKARLVTVDNLDTTPRASGGFGHTGI